MKAGLSNSTVASMITDHNPDKYSGELNGDGPN